MGLIWKCALVVVPIAIIISACGIYKVVYELHQTLNEVEKPGEEIKPNTWYLFTKFDKNYDGFLDANEFQAAIDHTLKQVSQQGQASESQVLSTDSIKKSLLNKSKSDNEEVMVVKADFKPLDLTTTSKHKHEGGMDVVGAKHLKGLKNWQQPFVREVDFSSQDFKIFLPTYNAKVGDTWEIISPITSKFERNLPHHRMHPPIPKNQREQVLVDLLSLLHPRPFIQTRFVPQGTTAVLRAINKDYYDIIFRMHAEFQINEPPDFAFWYTPAQFTGRVLIAKNGRHVEDFNMFVPTDKKLNVDMEWITGRKKEIEHIDDAWEMEVDIGFMPEMSLRGDGPTRKMGSRLPEYENVVWDVEISEWEARRTLQQKFYPFQRVLYRPFNETYEVAEKEDKLVHQVLLWGSLDDQSC